MCYPTLEDAISVATGGAVNLPTGATQQQVDDALLNQTGGTSVVLSIDYRDTHYQGRTFVWYSDHSTGCNGWNYYQPSMPSGWDNEVSSSHAYTGCNHNPHYQYTKYGGSIYPCTCYSMDIMNDRTSSEKWYA